MGAESGMNSSVRDDRVALSDGAKALWGKTNRIDDSEWLPLYVHMVDSAAMASKIWDTWVPQGTKAVIVGDLGNDEVLIWMDTQPRYRCVKFFWTLQRLRNCLGIFRSRSFL